MSEKRKIVLVGSAYPLRGGLSNYNERLIREFQQRGDEAYIYTFSLQYPSFLFPGKTQYSTDPPPHDLNIKICINSINPFNWIKIGRELKKLRPDIVIIKFWIPFMAPCFGTIARIVRKNKHTKVISIIDNIIPHERRIGDLILAKFWVNSVDGFVAMSKSVLEDLNTFDKKKEKQFCPHPIYDNFGKAVEKNVAREKLNLDKNFNYILFFGFIRDYKGLDLLLNAFISVLLKNQKIKLIVAGEFYSDSKPYLDIIEKNNLQNNVILATDFIPDSEVYAYFCASDIIVQPYKHATQSGVTQIAYHFNKPMIITDVGGLKEFVPDGKVGYVVKPDENSIAEAILNFYDGKKEKEFIENVKEEKKKYSWKRMVETIDKLSNL